MKEKKRVSREELVSQGFIEGQDFYISHSGKPVSLIKNVARACNVCGLKKPPNKFFSALHRHCRACRRKIADNVAVDSPEAMSRAAAAAEAMPNESPKAAVQLHQKEIARRTLARRRLIYFVQQFQPNYKAGWVHEDICRRLERFLQLVVEGKSPRLLLFCPPRLGKSLLASQYFPAWALGHYPGFEFIAASYNNALPIGFSRRIRELLRDPFYMAMFNNTRLSEESQAVEAWRTTAGGGYITAGVGTGITGKGCHIGVIDDPIKDWEAADSAQIRDACWDWYLSTFYTRVAPGGGILGIQTRWNEDDWAGRIIMAMDSGEGEKFEVVSYPAINEEGDEYLLPDDSIVQLPPDRVMPEDAKLLRAKGSALHPDRYDLDHLTRIKKNFIAGGNERMWNALYQQTPAPDEGLHFRREWFQYYAHQVSLRGKNVYQAWDFSITEKQTSDWCVGSCFAQDADDNAYEIDMVRFKVDEDGIMIADAIIDFWLEHQPFVVGVEDGQIWKSIKSTLERRCQERGRELGRSIAINIEPLTPLTDKKVRAGPLRGRMQLRKVWMKKDAPWRKTVDTELLRFPAGKNDDIVDSYSWNMRLVLMHQPPKPPAPPKLPSWKDRIGSGRNSDVSHMAA